MKTMDELNTDVSRAVHQAESLVHAAIKAYEELVRAEWAIVDHPHALQADREYAARGVETATTRLILLRKVFG